MKIKDDFKKHIQYLDMESLEKSHDSIFILDHSLNIVGYNNYYMEFAVENGFSNIDLKYGIETNILNILPDVLKSYYENAWKNALTNNLVFTHEYECSSPTRYRKFYQTAYPIVDGAGLVVTNHCVVESDNRSPVVTLEKKHINSHGFIVQCSNCRKVQDHGKLNKWDWIPSLLTNMQQNTSHSICPHCLDHYYPDFLPR